MIERAFTSARDLLETNRSILDRCAKVLLDRETLTADDLRGLTAGLRLDSPLQIPASAS